MNFTKLQTFNAPTTFRRSSAPTQAFADDLGFDPSEYDLSSLNANGGVDIANYDVVNDPSGLFAESYGGVESTGGFDWGGFFDPLLKTGADVGRKIAEGYLYRAAYGTPTGMTSTNVPGQFRDSSGRIWQQNANGSLTQIGAGGVNTGGRPYANAGATALIAVAAVIGLVLLARKK